MAAVDGVRRGNAYGPGCYLALYLDGTHYWMPGSTDPPDIDQLTVQGLEGIEIYRGPAETPIRFQITNSACGVALLWTRESP